MEQFKKKFTTMRQELAETVKKENAANERCEELRAKLKACEDQDLAAQVSMLESDLDLAEEETSNLKAKLAASEANVEELSRELKSSLGTSSGDAGKRREFEQRYSNLEENINKKDAENEDLARQIQVLEEDLESAETAGEDSALQVSALSGKEQEWEQLHRKVKLLESQVKNAEAKAELWGTKRDGAQKDLAALEEMDDI